MKFFNRSIGSFAIVTILLLLLCLACKKSLTGTIEDKSKNRSFTPSNLRVSIVKDSAKFTWNTPLYIAKGDTYTLELSTDSLFSKIDYKRVTDTTAVLIMDTSIKLNTAYFIRVKVNESPTQEKAASGYAYNTKPFRLTGQQYFKVVRDFEITPTSVLLHWYTGIQTAGLTQLVIIRPDLADTSRVSISAAEISAGQKTVSGLLPKTRYTVQLLAGTKSKGILSFTTPDVVVFTTVLSPADNLATAITAAQSGDIIGLNPGTYNLSSITYITQKKIAIRSVSNDPSNTKILCREINLVGDSAAVTLAGIEFNGNYAGTSYGVNLLQLYGTQATTSAAAAFGSIRIDNCIIHDYTRCLIRGNYGASANAQSIESIAINNSRVYNIDQANTGGYYTFSLEKLLIRSLSVTKSTFYQVGQGLVNMSTNLLTTTGIVPKIKFDYCTFNNFGGGSAKYLLIDANANKIIYSVSNSILANTPISGSLQAAAFRATGSGSDLSFNNNNTFRFASISGGAALNITGLQTANPSELDLGWTAATTNFSLTSLPADHLVFFASTNGNTLGDPRWAY